MKRHYTFIYYIAIIVCTILAMPAGAQEISTGLSTPEISENQSSECMEPASVAPAIVEEISAPLSTLEIAALQAMTCDSLSLPILNRRGQMPYMGYYPYLFGGWYGWRLHKGLNVSMGASVFAEFGKHARHGAGFTQDIALMYAAPINNRLSIAVGAYFDNIYWLHNAYRSGGLNAILSYRFDEHWEASVYAQKSIVNNIPMPRHLMDLSRLGDRIGASVTYNFSPSFSIQVSVEKNIAPTPAGMPNDDFIRH